MVDSKRMMYHSTDLSSKLDHLCFDPHRLHEAPELEFKKSYVNSGLSLEVYFLECILEIKHTTTYVVWTLSTGYKNPELRTIAATIQGHSLCFFLFQEFRTHKRTVKFQLRLPKNLSNTSIHKFTKMFFYKNFGI